MSNMKYLFIAAAVTLFAGFAPLLLLTSPVGVIIAKVAIAVSVIGFAVTTTLYFMHESTAALTLRDEDFHWH